MSAGEFIEIQQTAKLKLLPTPEQKKMLGDTFVAFKDAENYASQIAYEHGRLSNSSRLQNLVLGDGLKVYRHLRDQFGLKSDHACNVCIVVAGAYKTIKENEKKRKVALKKSEGRKPPESPEASKHLPKDRPAKWRHAKVQLTHGKGYSFKNPDVVSILTVAGRIEMPFVAKGFERYFDGSWEFGAATLVFKKGKWRLHVPASKQVPAVSVSAEDTVVGVDLGMSFLSTAVRSDDGKPYFEKGRWIKDKRARYMKARQSLQAKGTKRAKRRLKALSGRENRFMADVNHRISKTLVQYAGKNALITAEDLTRINWRTRVRKRDRYYRFGWAFHQLRSFIEYKAKAAGVSVVAVDPRHTSQRCPKCGHTEKANRNKKTHVFRCKACGYTSNDDRVAAMNLRQAGIEYRNKALGSASLVQGLGAANPIESANDSSAGAEPAALMSQPHAA